MITQVMDLKTEEELVKRAQHDREAFGELYELYYPKIFNYALRHTASVQLAMDITSSTFLKAMSQIKKFRWKDVPFSAWLYKIASNEINDHYRSGAHRLVSLESVVPMLDAREFSDEVMEAEEQLSQHEEFLHLHQKLAELPEKYQEVIILKFFEKKKIKDIVQILGKKEGTVKSLLHRGLERLKQNMQ